MTKMKIIPPLTDLSNGLALQAMRNINESELTLYRTLDIQRPTTLNNFRIFAHELQLAYQQGEAQALHDAIKIKADNVSFIGAGKPRIERTKGKLILCFVDESRPTKLQRHYFGLGTPQQVEYMMQTQQISGTEQYEAGFKNGLADRLIGEVVAADQAQRTVAKLEAKLAELERFANNHPDTKLLDYLTSRASINFDEENCLVRFKVPSTFEGANNLRDILRTAMQNSEAQGG